MHKCWFVLSLILLAHPAFAAAKAGPEPSTARETVEPRHETPSQEKPKAHPRKARHLPRGDMRHCLELKDNEMIIKCAETEI